MKRRVLFLSSCALLALLIILGSGVLQQPPTAQLETPPALVTAQQTIVIDTAQRQQPEPAAITPTKAENTASASVVRAAITPVPASPVSASPAPLLPVPPAAIVQLPVPVQPVANQIVITFNPDASPEQQQDYLKSIGATVVQNVDALNTVVANVPSAVAAQPLPASPSVATSEPDYFAVALEAPVNDLLYEQQWALPVIGAPDGWTLLPLDTPMVIVAVVDSGVCADHPDLIGRILPGYDFVDADETPQDDFGHGCNVAGVIAANGNNGLGIAGVAPNAQILPVRVLNAQGIGTYSDVAAGIVYAADHGAQIINLSLGGVNPSSVLQNAVDYAVSKGALVIAAAGNNGGAVLYPAAYAPVVAVASVDSNLQRSSFSSYGPEVDLLAPGRDILTTSADGSYRTVSGTSFAAPHVAGVAALDIALGQTLGLDGGIVKVGGGGENTAPTATATIQANITATAGNTALPATPTLKPTLVIDFEFANVPQNLQDAINDAIVTDLSSMPEYTTFTVSSIRQEQDWFDITIVPSYVVESGWENINLDEIRFVIAHAQPEGQILAYLENSPSFAALAQSVPDSFLASSSEIAPQAEGHLFPWTKDQSWRKTTGWHTNYSSGSPQNAVDFAPNSGAAYAVLASQGGTVRQICGSDSYQRMLYIDHGSSAESGYLHIDAGSIPASIIGQNVSRGRYLGEIYSGSVVQTVSYTCSVSNPRYRTPCGCGTGPHLHYTFPTRSMTIDSFDANTVANSASPNNSFTSSNVRTDNNATATPPPDTGSGAMKLYSLTGYGGTVLFSSNGGFSNDPAANSYSMLIPNGWSVKTWRADNGSSSGAEERCWSSSVTNLQDHGWQNSIQSIEVFTSNVCSPPPSSDVRLCRTDDGNDCTPFPIGSDSNLTDNGLNDQVRSVRVPSGKSLFVFNDENFRNSADCYTSDRIPLPIGSPWDMRGQVTSTVILNQGDCPWSQVNSVVLFETNNFSGAKMGVGSYPHWENIPQLNSYFNDKVVSIHIPTGLSVYLWEHDNRAEPRTACLTGDIANLGSMAGKASSIEVFPNTSCQPAVPVVPANLHSTGVTETSITLGWNDGANEDGYKIYKWGVVNDVWDFYYLASVGANVTSYTDTGLNCAGVYHYQVSAYNGGGDSGRTAFISETTANCTAPPVPSNLHVTNITADSITLDWNDGTNETGYKIYKWSVVNDVWDFYYLTSVGANVTSYTDTGLNCAGVYHYQISAYNSNGESGRTAFISETTANCTAPPVPTNLRATTITSSSITLDWNDGANETGYKVYKWGEVGGVWDFYYLASVGANITTYTDDGLSCAGIYHYQISAYNNTGESERTGWIQVIAADCTDTAPPNGRMTTPGRQSFQAGPIVTVKADAWDDTSGVNRVEFYRWNGSGWELIGSDNSIPYEIDWNISSVPEGFLWVSAIIYDNAGNNSDILSGDENWTYFWIDRTPPTSAVNALPANQPSLSFPVTWAGTDAIAGNDYLLYDVQYQEDCAGDWYDWVVMDSMTGATFYGDWSREYCFRSRAYDPAGNVEAWPDSTDASTRTLEDTTAPTANFITPLADSLLNTSDVTIWLDAADTQSGLSYVDFLVGYDDGLGAATLSMEAPPPPDLADGQEASAQGWDWHRLVMDTDGSDGWSTTWDASGVPDQTRNISFFAFVYDRVGNEGWTRINYVTLDRAVPTGSMTIPLRNSHQKGPTIPLRADVTDATSGVSRVKFYAWSAQPWSNQEWIYLGEDTTSPYEYNWSIGSITDGQVFLTAEVTDRAGNSIWLWGDSEWAWIAVDRTPPTSSVDGLPPNQETNEFVVTWSGSDNITDGNYLRYDVQYQLDCIGSWLNWHTQIEGVQAGLFIGEYGHSYCFRSRAYDAAGNIEAWPGAADATTRVRDPLAAPTGLTPNHDSQVGRFDPITLSWNPVSDATGYSVEFLSNNVVLLASDWITESSWTIPAQVGGQYQWHVKARDAIMESNWSTTQNLAVRYGPPADLTITSSNNYQVGLAWTPSVDAPDNIDGYVIDFMINGNFSRRYWATAGATTLLASGLECETAYTIVVRAKKGSLESDNSNEAAVTMYECILQAPVPYSPAYSSSISERQPSFSWSSRNYATGYEIQLGTTNPPTTSPIAVNSTYYYSSSPLLTTTYYWRVRSVRNGRTSDWSSTWVFTVTSPASAAPTRNLVTTATPTLSWGQLPWATAYQVEWSTTTAFNAWDWYYKRLDVSASKLSVPTDPLPDGTYYWRVRAQKPDNTWSGWSAVESFTIDVP